ncbi:protein of unknown function [Marinobacter sp. LV10R510-11A]|uniref:DUF4124 domain-containing protein n=1 Tax=Marinobacter sp. LV10R510-11A TaxID=1415568 RepID=UPI000BC070C9|nr:DUF4124 domain-containing protein [Marinobacter sp. LV10R510-11A]SOB76306.1 protein of unknown function [Marinobacter sp. LV10R510-11A]
MKGLIIPILLLVTPITQAGAYRWVDGNGQTHFGDRPPANAAADEVRLIAAQPTLDAAASERKQRVSEFLAQSQKERAAREKVEAKREAKAAKLKARCDALRARVKYLKSVSGIYRLNKEGERVFVNDEENERIRKEFQVRVQSECNI